MEQLFVNKIIQFGQNAGGEVLSGILLVILYIIILFLWKYYSKEGLYLYNILAIIVANIQVLKVTPFWLSPEPVALGTLLFATTFLVSDILTEHYGIEVAHQGIKLSFMAQIIMTILMLITAAYPSPGGITGIAADKTMIDSVQAGLYTLFAPSIRILAASLIAYYISQWVDIKIFKYLKNYTNKKLLWLRVNVSTLLSGLLDNILFSLFAWVIFSPAPVSVQSLIFTYILGTYVARVVVSITSTPIIYLSYKFFPREIKCHSPLNS
jgi:queuosine precursor transporter